MKCAYIARQKLLLALNMTNGGGGVVLWWRQANWFCHQQIQSYTVYQSGTYFVDGRGHLSYNVYVNLAVRIYLTLSVTCILNKQP